jgi:hypothetical protein
MFFNLFQKPQRETIELTLDEKNRSRADRELSAEIAARAEERQKQEVRAAQVKSLYGDWLEEFQYQLFRVFDDSKFRIENGELSGVVCLRDTTLDVSSRLDKIDYRSSATSTIWVSCQDMEEVLYFCPKVEVDQPEMYAERVFSRVSLEMGKTHQRRVQREREERKAAKREILERNRQRNLSKRGLTILPKS